MIAIINYGTGNLKSLSNALNRLKAQYIITCSRQEILSCDKVILPGVGDAGFAMQMIREKQLEGVIKECTMPVLGICLGMQLLCSSSEEGNTQCLGIFPNKVLKFSNQNDSDALKVYHSPKASFGSKADPITVENAIGKLKIPQMGWNTIENLSSALYSNIPPGSFVYFVHSYYAQVNKYTISTTNYGVNFSSSLKKGNFMGCQFHPEKSGDIGERILENFVRL